MAELTGSNRPSLSENVTSTPGILRVVVTGNFNVYRLDNLRIFNFLFVRTQLHILNCERQCKNFFINTTYSVIAPRSLSHFHLNSHFRHICYHTFLGHALSPNSKVAFRPLDRCHQFPCLNVKKPSLILPPAYTGSNGMGLAYNRL